jgi:hypothetical protein
MRISPQLLISALVSMLFAGTAFTAGTEVDYKRAYAAAEAAEKQAGALRNRWTAAEASLAEARKAAEKGDFDQAISAAKEAEALAKASVFQAESEKDAWKTLELR